MGGPEPGDVRTDQDHPSHALLKGLDEGAVHAPAETAFRLRDQPHIGPEPLPQLLFASSVVLNPEGNRTGCQKSPYPAQGVLGHTAVKFGRSLRPQERYQAGLGLSGLRVTDEDDQPPARSPRVGAAKQADRLPQRAAQTARA